MVTSAKGFSGAVKIGGSDFVAPSAATGTVTGATSLGYVSDAGLTRTINTESSTVKAWGGTTVAQLFTGKTETFQFSLIEADNMDAAGLVFGSAEDGTVISTNAGQDEHPYVIDMKMLNGKTKRLYIPKGVVTAIGNITYSDSAVIAYDITITAIADSSDNTVYEYNEA